jgi:phycocyanin alpha chain
MNRAFAEIDVVALAQAEERFLNDTEWVSIRNDVRQATSRIDAAKDLTSKSESLVAQSSAKIFEKFPKYASADQDKAKCARDISYFIRIVTYCLVVGNTGPIDEYISGLTEVYRALGLSSECAIDALKYIRENHGLLGDECIETNVYIDYLINGLDLFESQPQKSEDVLFNDEYLYGVFAVPHQRKVIFEKQFNLTVDNLARLKPNINIDMVILEATDV